jgi:hypothetical protein
MSEKADEREMLLTFKHSIDGRGIVRWSPSSFKREECRLVFGEDLVPGRCHEFLFSWTEEIITPELLHQFCAIKLKL